MQTLSLTPLPLDNSDECRSHLRLRSEGFVDEALVSGLITRGLYERAFVQPEGMVLSSSEDDYAGWALPVPSPFRGMQEVQEVAALSTRRPAPPVAESADDAIENAYTGGHRWWLFGMSGAMACGLLALTLFSLAQRVEVREIASGFVPVPIESAEQPAAIAAEPVLQPALTEAQPLFR